MLIDAPPFEALSAYVVSEIPPLDRCCERLAIDLVRRVVRSGPVAPSELSAVGWDEADVARLPARRIRVDGQGRIVGCFGASASMTEHALNIGERTVFAWCAWDTLFLPRLLGAEACVQSRCSATGAAVRVAVGVDRLAARFPPDVVVSFVRPNDPDAHVTDSFCRYVQFFESEPTAADWLMHRDDRFVLGLDAAFALGAIGLRRDFPSLFA